MKTMQVIKEPTFSNMDTILMCAKEISAARARLEIVKRNLGNVDLSNVDSFIFVNEEIEKLQAAVCELEQQLMEEV